MFAELVCSNSFKAERLGSAAGLLKAEMELLGSLSFERDFTPGSSAFRAFAGVNIALCEVDWKSLF